MSFGLLGVGSFGSLGLPEGAGTPPWVKTFQSAFALRNTQRITAAMLGDSTFEGLGLASTSVRVGEVLRDLMRNAYPVSGVSAGGFVNNVPGYYDTGTAIDASSPAITAGVTKGSFWGYGSRSVVLPSTTTTDSVTFSLTSVTRFVVTVAKNAAAVMGVSVNGGAVQNVTLTQTNAGGFIAYDSGNVTLGNYTVVLTRISGGLITIEGVLAYNGDYASGFRVLDDAMSGQTSSHFVTSGWHQTLRAEPVDLVICDLGYNDFLVNAATPSAMATNLATIQSNVRSVNTKIDSWLFVALPAPLHNVSPAPLSPWSSYVTAMQGVAASDPLGRSGFLNLSALIPSWPVGPDYSMVQGDDIHPNAKGATWYAENIMSAMFNQALVQPS